MLDFAIQSVKMDTMALGLYVGKVAQRVLEMMVVIVGNLILMDEVLAM